MNKNQMLFYTKDHIYQKTMAHSLEHNNKSIMAGL